MITKSLKQFASPIIDNAMATGGRSSSTTTTDYSTIGNALTQKAQNDLQMAQIKGDMAIRMADLTANNQLQIIGIEDARQKQELADRAASKDMGTMEKVMGVIQGAASGAQAGMAVGGPKGAIIGGVLGGAAAGHSATSGDPGDVKRERMGQTNQTLGGIATIATATRSMYNDYKGKEVYKNGMDNLGKLQQGIGAMGPGPQKDAAVAEYQSKMQSMNGELGKYMGPAEAGKAMEGIRAGQSGLVSNDPEVRRNAEYAQVGIQMRSEASGDGPLSPNSPTRTSRLKQLHGQLDALNNEKYGYDGKHNISPQEFSQLAGGIDPELGRAVTAYSTGGQTAGGAQSASQVSGAGGVNPRTGTPTGPASYSQTAPTPTANPGGMGSGSRGGYGIAMDDGGSITPTVNDLTKIGGEAAKVMSTQEQGSRAQTGRAGASGEWGGDGDAVEKRIEELRQDPRAKGLKEERIRAIAEKEVAQQREENPESLKEAKQIRVQADERISQTKARINKIGLTDKGDQSKFSNVSTASKTVDEMIKVVESGDYPSGSQMDSMSVKMRRDGINVGAPVGAAVGSLAAGIPSLGVGAGAGAAVGAGVGYKMGEKFPVGKGKKGTLSAKQANAVDKMTPYEQDFIFSYNKTMDEGVTREFEAEEAKKLLPNPALTKAENLANLYRLKGRIADKLDTIEETAMAGTTGAIKLIEKQESTKQKYEANTKKRYDETYQNEKAKRDFERDYPEEEEEGAVSQGTFFH